MYDGGMKTDTTPLFLRVRPSTKALLERACFDQRRTLSSLAEAILINGLQDYKTTEQKLNEMLNRRNHEE